MGVGNAALAETQLAGKPTVWYPWLTAAATPYMHLPAFTDSKFYPVISLPI